MSKPRILITPRIIDHPSLSTPGVGCRTPFVESVLAAGGAPFIAPLTRDIDSLRTLFDIADGILLPGGEDINPEAYGEQPHEKLGAVSDERDFVEIHFTDWAYRENKPLLGICRGLQLVNVQRGGTLWQDLGAQFSSPSLHPEEGGWEHLQHKVTLRPGSKLGQMYGRDELLVNSLHHQGIKELGAGLEATAVAEDGIIEGIESAAHRFFVAVQWHPEVLWQRTDPLSLQLFRQFIEAC